jgi:hypothetical protein
MIPSRSEIEKKLLIRWIPLAKNITDLFTRNLFGPKPKFEEIDKLFGKI